MIRKIKAFILKIVKYLRWRIEAKQISALAGINNSRALDLSSEDRILVIAPHADDELIGCHQLISNNKNNIIVFYCSYLGSNPSVENKKKREHEFIDYMNYHGTKYKISSPSTLHYDIAEILKSYKPSYVFLPSYVDWHYEHRLINHDLLQSIRTDIIPFIIGWYHITMPIPAFCANAYSSMSRAQHEEKWNAMNSYYPSQLHMDLSRFKFIEKLSGNYAETYVILTKDQWERAIEILAERDDDLNGMKNILGKIKKIYNLSSYYYNLILS